MSLTFVNNTTASVTSGGTTAPSSGSTESWTVGSIVGFPTTLLSGDWFHVADPVLQAEKVKVTAITGSGPTYTWTVTRGDESTATVAHAANFAIQQVVSGADFYVFTQAYNVKSYGAKGDGSTDDTTAIQNALTAAGNYQAAQYTGGATVFFPPGIYMASGLTIPQNVTVRGSGVTATTIRLTAGAAAHAFLVQNAQLVGTSYDADCCQVFDLTLDGNKANVTAGSPWQCGLVLQNRLPSGNYEFNDARHVVDNVLIQNFTGDGMVQWGQGQSLYSNIQVWLCNGFGVVCGQDCKYTAVDVGACGLDGFLITGGSNNFNNCKAWFNGAALVSSRGVGATTQTVNPGPNVWDGANLTGFTYGLSSAGNSAGFGNGFLLRDLSGTGTYSTNVGGAWGGGTMTNCNAQDNARAGFCLSGGRWGMAGLNADSNSNCGTSSGTTPLASFAGVEIQDNNAGSMVISGISWDRGANTNHQQAVLYCGTGTGNLNVNLAGDGKLNDNTTHLPMLLSGSVVSSSVKLYFSTTGEGGTVTQATSKSTSVTLNNPSGQITMNGASLAAGTIVSFTLTNTFISSTDVLVLNHVSAGTPGSYSLNAQCGSGSATINVRNNTAGSLSEAIVIGFAVVYGVTS